MSKDSVREALGAPKENGLSYAEREAIKEAWYSSLSHEKLISSQQEGRSLAKYHSRSGWTIKDEPPFNASSLIRNKEIRVMHYIFEWVDYRGIKKRFQNE